MDNRVSVFWKVLYRRLPLSVCLRVDGTRDTHGEFTNFWGQKSLIARVFPTGPFLFSPACAFGPLGFSDVRLVSILVSATIAVVVDRSSHRSDDDIVRLVDFFVYRSLCTLRTSHISAVFLHCCFLSIMSEKSDRKLRDIPR